MKIEKTLGRSLRIIYLGGYGWSGTTLIERLLSLSPQILAAGELHHLEMDLRKIEICSCGQKCDVCVIWKLYDRFCVDKTITIDKLVDHFQKNTNYRALTDNSKTTAATVFRPLRYRRQSIFFIHVIRKGLDCLQSNLKRRTQEGLITAFKSGLQFVLAHFAAILYRRYFGRENYQLIYLDITSHQYQDLNLALQKMNIEISPLKSP